MEFKNATTRNLVVNKHTKPLKRVAIHKINESKNKIKEINRIINENVYKTAISAVSINLGLKPYSDILIRIYNEKNRIIGHYAKLQTNVHLADEIKIDRKSLSFLDDVNSAIAILHEKCINLLPIIKKGQEMVKYYKQSEYSKSQMTSVELMKMLDELEQ